MELVEQDAMVMLTTGVTSPTRMLSMFPDTSMAVGDVATHLPALLVPRSHIMSNGSPFKHP
jgi:hypothetical protein